MQLNIIIILSSLLHITTCTVYTVTPDDHYYPNTTCHHCHNLQHYLLNITKYFTSNTQLLFLPGLHHLHTDLIIQNVHNISLIGSTANGTTLDTVIQCQQYAMYINTKCITISNVSTLIIRNLIINIATRRIRGIINIKDCFYVSLNYLKVQFHEHNHYFALECINIMGSSNFSHITLPRYGNIELFYNETRTDRQHHILRLDNCRVQTLIIDMIQKSYIVTLRIVNIQVHDANQAISAKELGTNEVFIANSKFISISYRNSLFSFTSSHNGSVKFINCQFKNNKDDVNFFLKSPWPWKLINPSLIKHWITVEYEL